MAFFISNIRPRHREGALLNLASSKTNHTHVLSWIGGAIYPNPIGYGCTVKGIIKWPAFELTLKD